MIITKIQEVFLRLGYRFFDENKPYNLNIVGVRSSIKKAGRFDDVVFVIYRTDLGHWEVKQYKATTDSGSYYLQRPLHPDGTAIMLPDQYRGAYKIGIHGRSWTSGGYEALEQVKPMRYVRDNNKDDILDIDGKVITGNLKTNIHRAYKNKVSEFIWKYSAGCQVIADINDFAEFMNLCHKSVDRGFPDCFTYTLLTQEQLDFDGEIV